jgi:hypothetical protein
MSGSPRTVCPCTMSLNRAIPSPFSAHANDEVPSRPRSAIKNVPGERRCPSTSRTTSLIEHTRGRYRCPLFHPAPTGQPCPIDDPHWAKGGCKTTLATSIGARILHQLDRDGDDYKDLYKQRTATERVNSQAVALGIERPKLRHMQAIANLNTLIYVLINLRALHRVRLKLDQIGKEQQNR